VGNKIDDAEKRAVSTEEGQAKATDLKVQFVETSAKVGINVKVLFKNLASILPGIKGVQLNDKTEQETSGGFKIEENKQQKQQSSKGQN
jgi:GTPase SAR1 family protein